MFVSLVRLSRLISLVTLASASLYAQVSVTVQNPTNNSSTTSPAPVQATGTAVTGQVTSMHILVDGIEVFFEWGDSLNTYLWMAKGWHTVEVRAVDDGANVSNSQMMRVYSKSGKGTLDHIEDMTPWQNCTDASCAGGQGGQGASVVTLDAPNQTSPSLDNSSHEFYLGGTGSYGNAYWYKFLGGSSSVSNYNYDFWVQVSDANAPQALEFDVNHSYNNQRWVFGTECNLKLTKTWRVWDANSGWVDTGVSCTAATFPANAWTHIVWSVYRRGRTVIYRSVTVNGVQHGLGMQLNNQQNWTGADIDVTLQMDGDQNQTPYYVWLDRVSLTAY